VIRNGRRQAVPRTVVARPISVDVAAQLTDIMEAVVTDGTGKNSQVEGYTIAGKTGTANKVVNRGYSQTDYNVSFVGFVPSRNPAFAIVVMVDSPHKAPPYGGSVSAPIFQKIAAAALRYRAVPPNINPQPAILVARRDEQQHEEPVSMPADRPAVVTLAAAATGTAAVYPDLAGLSARDAVRALGKLGVSGKLVGSGLVVAQQPAAGAPFDPGNTVVLKLQRQPVVRSPNETPQ
jgi:membrane peptidoglycan carboxypeptidase